MLKATQQHIMAQTTQTIIACALACEAKPLIDAFKLKKITDIHAFSVYQAGSVFLIVSGMGQTNMSAAINWLSGYLQSYPSLFWLNIGVAGHPSADIGHLFCALKISDQQQSLYPTKWSKHKITLEPLITVNNEELLYQEQALYDMEGFAFYQSATRFNSQERVQCLKIISDNKEHAVNRDKTYISNLIAHQCEHIMAFIALHTGALEKLNFNSNAFKAFQQQLTDTLHFSHSQQLQLSKLCQSAQSHQIDLDSLDVTQETQAKNVLSLIKQQLDLNAVTL